MSSPPSARPSLAELNATFAFLHVDQEGFTLRQEYRVGYWHVDPAGSGGASAASSAVRWFRLLHRHLLIVDVILALPDNFDPVTDCAERDPAANRGSTRLHGTENHAPCFARTIGFAMKAWPICRKKNVHGIPAFEPKYLDTDGINCANCLSDNRLKKRVDWTWG